MRSIKSDPSSLSAPPSLVFQLANEVRRVVFQQQQQQNETKRAIESTSISFNHDGSKLFVGYHGALELWDFRGENEMRLLGWLPISPSTTITSTSTIGNNNNTINLGITLCEFIGTTTATTNSDSEVNTSGISSLARVFGAFVDASQLNLVRFVTYSTTHDENNNKLVEITNQVLPLQFEHAIASIKSNCKYLVIGMRDVISIYTLSLPITKTTTTTSNTLLNSWIKPCTNLRNMSSLNDVLSLGPSRWLAYISTTLTNTSWTLANNFESTTGLSSNSTWPNMLDEAVRSLTRSRGNGSNNTVAAHTSNNNNNGKSKSSTTTMITKKDSPFTIVIRDITRSKDIVRIHARDAVQFLSFDRSGGLIVYSQLFGRVLFVNSLPDGKTLYKLDRGLIPATISSLSFSWDGRFVALSSDHGTTHVFALNPGLTGGVPSIFTHPCSETRGGRNNGGKIVEVLTLLGNGAMNVSSKILNNINTINNKPEVITTTAAAAADVDHQGKTVITTTTNDEIDDEEESDTNNNNTNTTTTQPISTHYRHHNNVITMEESQLLEESSSISLLHRNHGGTINSTSNSMNNDEFIEIDPPLATVTMPGIPTSHHTTHHHIMDWNNSTTNTVGTTTTTERPDAFHDSVIVLQPLCRVRVASSLHGLIPHSRFTSNGKLILISGDASIVAYRFIVFADEHSCVGLEPRMVSRFPCLTREISRMSIDELAAYNQSFHFDLEQPNHNVEESNKTNNNPRHIIKSDRFQRVTHISPIVPIWQQNFTLIPLGDDPIELLQQHDDYCINPETDMLNYLVEDHTNKFSSNNEVVTEQQQQQQQQQTGISLSGLQQKKIL
jgi:hypothetical protein